MTLAQNHRRPSNGNNTGSYRYRIVSLILLGLMALNAQSCGFIQDLFGEKKVVMRPKDKEEEAKVEIRELKWKDVTKDEEVIRTYPHKEVEAKEFYEVLCFLPFNGDHQQKGRDLYTGLKMAANDLQSELKIRFTTFDVNRVRKEPDVVRKLLATPEFDLIIAPYANQDVNQVIDLAKGGGAAILSPWNTSTSVHRFPGYIQLNPGIESHFKEILDFTSREYTAGRTIIMGERKDAQLVGMLQNRSPGLEVFYTSSNPKENFTQMTNLISSKNIQAVIIPTWRSADEAYFVSLLSAINATRSGRKINVFLLASWLDNDNIPYDQFKGMNLHFTNSRFVDYKRSSFQRFDEAYFRNFKYFANDDVYYGHDIFLLASGLLHQYGFQIPQQVVNFECGDCFFSYDFVSEVDEEGDAYILNDHVDIISFEDYQYRRVN